MKTIEIKGSKRSDLTKQSVKALRNSEHVPCVLYGGAEPVHFSAHLADFKHLVYTPDVYLVKLIVDGKEYMSMMQDIQFHPVNDIIQHIDFLEVTNDKPVTINIPIKFSGASEGVKQGGKLVTKVRRLKVKALPAALPDFISVDITPLKIGGNIRVRDLTTTGVTFLDSPSNVIVGVRITRNVAAAEATAEKK
ncbi:MAG: 50S ribosomal protein L25/general stress protein Ctc [Bacteroidetes bacterium]|jgi:large subunit ribosomal protein L25|nr:50S ribosomal protein L25/general stress protein Ctc [Bacteroidota bacterium]MBK9320368.1 50S ribosomal protein L25/general stress protein Ctc [Bacteroidota bacterium]